MNLYQGDSLELDINKEFNKSIFDIIPNVEIVSNEGFNYWI